MLRRTLLAATAATLFLSACAKNQIAPTSSTGGLNRAQMRKIIQTALNKRGWTIIDEQPGVTRAKFVKNSGTAAIFVKYDDKTYTIDIDPAGTTLLKDDGKVHRKYNQWVQTLDKDIQTLILKAK